MGGIFIPARESAGVVLCDEPGPATAWSGTELASAWATATGRSYNPSDELMVATAGTDDAPVELAVFKNVNDVLLQVPGSAICWSPLGSVEIDAVLATDPSAEPSFSSGDDLTISVIPRVIAGATSVAGQPLGFLLPPVSLLVDLLLALRAPIALNLSQSCSPCFRLLARS